MQAGGAQALPEPRATAAPLSSVLNMRLVCVFFLENRDQLFFIYFLNFLLRYG